VTLAARFPREASSLESARPLLVYATTGDLATLRTALAAEARVEQEKDRAYWAPFKREMEAFRRAERTGESPP
jgi:hypothetical protein